MQGRLWYKLRIISLLLVISLAMILSVIVGFTGQFFYWLIFDVLIRNHRQVKPKLNLLKEKNNDEYYALIIGAGYSGLGIAIKLKELDTNDFLIIERHEHVGGTWYANKYPGCACDIPSNLYSFSFEPNPEWSHFYSRQPEIGKYLEHCSTKYDIHRHIQFNTTVTQLKWLDDKQIWQVTITSNAQEKQVYARFIMAGYGLLSNASYPTDISGIDKFQGQMCHTAEWNETIDLKNKRVAVVGTGSSASQCVPQIHRAGVKELLLFQRTPGWVLPRLDRNITECEKTIFRKVPIIQKFLRGLTYWIFESLVFSFVYRLPIRFVIEQLVKFNLVRQVKDEELRKKLTPTWDVGCKRMLFSNDWYPTIQQPNVKLITNRIREITTNSIVTYDDDNEYPVDIIVWSTGFQVQQFPLTVYGVNGCSLGEQFSESMQVRIYVFLLRRIYHVIYFHMKAYRGVTVPNFPNFFIFLGPNTALGHNSVVIMIEAQIKYVVEALLYMQKNNIQTLDIKENIYKEFNQKIQAKLQTTVWQQGGCHAWYQDTKGNNTTIWPGFSWTYILFMKDFDFQNYNYSYM